MAENQTDITGKNRGGRPKGRSVQQNGTKIASGAISDKEDAALKAVAERTGQSRSEIVRRAVVNLLNADLEGGVFFGHAIAYRGADNGESHRTER